MHRNSETPRNLKVVPPANPPEGNQQEEVVQTYKLLLPSQRTAWAAASKLRQLCKILSLSLHHKLWSVTATVTAVISSYIVLTLQLMTPYCARIVPTLQTDDYLCPVPQLHVFIHITTRILAVKLYIKQKQLIGSCLERPGTCATSIR